MCVLISWCDGVLRHSERHGQCNMDRVRRQLQVSARSIQARGVDLTFCARHSSAGIFSSSLAKGYGAEVLMALSSDPAVAGRKCTVREAKGERPEPPPANLPHGNVPLHGPADVRRGAKSRCFS